MLNPQSVKDLRRPLVWLTSEKRTMIAAAMVSITIAAGSAVADSTVQAISGKKQGVIGSGYDSAKEDFTGVQCITAKETPTGPAESSFSLDEQLDERQASNELGFSVGGRARYGVIEASASAQFLTAAKSNDFSVSAVYSARYLFPVQKAIDLRRNDIGEKAKNSFESWNSSCGNSFVDEVRKGAKLFVSVRVDFSSREQKQEFQAKFSVSGPLAGVNAELKNASSSFGRNVKVSVAAYQFGGDVSKVTDIFPDAAARGAYTQCTLGTFESCAKVIEGILAYASDTKHGFPSQIAPDVKPGPAVISYSVAEYPRAIYEGVFPHLAPAVALSRNTLSDEFEKNYAQYVLATRLLRGNLTPHRRSAVQSSFDVIKKNQLLILNTSKICYDTPDKCPSEVNDKLRLFSVPMAPLQPTSFVTACIEALHMQPDDPLRLTVSRLVAIVNPRGFDQSKEEADCKVDGQLLNRTRNISLASNGTDQDKLTDISALEGLGSLEELNISGNAIADLSPLTFLQELRVLDASRNRISDLRPLTDLTELQKLTLEQNRIKDITPLSGLTKLTDVAIDFNEIKDLTPLAALPSLQTISANNNNIDNLACFKVIYRLKVLSVMDNLITEDAANKFTAAFPAATLKWKRQ